MFILENYSFEIQLLIDIFLVSAIVVLMFLYIKLSSSKKNSQLLSKIEYLCKNLKILVEKSEESSDLIQRKVDEFRLLYDKQIAEIERKSADLNEIVNRLEKEKGVASKLYEKDKYANVKSLLSDGHSVKTISHMLKINKGEVELIHKLVK